MKNKIITFKEPFTENISFFVAANNETHGGWTKVDGFVNIPFADHDALHNAIDGYIAIIMVETILGEVE